MADRNQRLTGDDLARPAKQLPLKVIRELSRKLHRQLPTSGNWETLAEDLGYGFEDIQQFGSLASIRPEVTPGETMLLDWLQRGNGCTLFVLHSALVKADRQDCAEYLEQEIYDKVVCMDLLFCVKDETTKETEHCSVRTRCDACLIDCLRHTLEEPIREKYILLDRNASWIHTSARDYKGRELMIMKKSSDFQMEQDPTVDSSNPALGNCKTPTEHQEIITNDSNYIVSQDTLGDTIPNENEITEEDETLRKVVHGVASEIGYPQVTPGATENEIVLSVDLNTPSIEDALASMTAEYEDPGGYSSDDRIDDNEPIYHYARDLSLEREDSITKAKSLFSTETMEYLDNTTTHQTSDFQQEDGHCKMENGLSNQDIHDNIFTVGDHLQDLDNNPDQFEDEPVYNDHQTLTLRDFYGEKHTIRIHDTILESDDPLSRPSFGTESEVGQSVKSNPEGRNKNTASERQDAAYIDFNNYPQTDSPPLHTETEAFVRHDSKRRGPFGKSCSARKPIGGDTMKAVRFASRCVSHVESRPSPYETLNRQASCPDIEYTSSSNARVSMTKIDFSTIAEAFSPSTDLDQQHEALDNESDKELQVQKLFSDLLTHKHDKLIHGKRNSYPGTDAATQRDKIKFARHSMPLVRDKRNVGTQCQSRPLPEIPVRSIERSMNSIQRQTSSALSFDSEGDVNDIYKSVNGGKSSRPMLDGCLANDKLFMHYNSELRVYKAWSPKETENTIDKTMKDVQAETGYYVLWYHRGKKNLIITVTDSSSGLLHFRVRTKVLDNRLQYYVTHSVILPDVRELLQHHHDNGLHVGEGRVIRMRLPVSVKYDRIPVSV